MDRDKEYYILNNVNQHWVIVTSVGEFGYGIIQDAEGFDEDCANTVAATRSHLTGQGHSVFHWHSTFIQGKKE